MAIRAADWTSNPRVQYTLFLNVGVYLPVQRWERMTVGAVAGGVGFGKGISRHEVSTRGRML